MQTNFRVDDENENTRLDVFLSTLTKDFSRNELQAMIKNANILVNNLVKKPSYQLKTDDVVSIKNIEKQIKEIKPQNIDLDIRYEDENMLVINKPFNMLTHPTANETEDTLVNALLFYTKGELSNVNGEFRPGIVHRLDRNTSGLLMVAKNNEAHTYLQEQIKLKKAKRKYLAIACGSFEQDLGTLNFDIGRHETKPEKMAVVKDGKPSITHYKVLERFHNHTYLELELATGRTHQIRVHLSHIKHPIVNDTLYGGKQIKAKTTEQALQAYSLSFLPMGSKNDILVEIEEDEDIKKVLKYLRSKK